MLRAFVKAPDKGLWHEFQQHAIANAITLLGSLCGYRQLSVRYEAQSLPAVEPATRSACHREGACRGCHAATVVVSPFVIE
jgi:hypothetical protein